MMSLDYAKYKDWDSNFNSSQGGHDRIELAGELEDIG